MKRRFEDLWAKAAFDGATTPLGVSCALPDDEVEQLLEAWSRERSERIETTLLLEQTCRLLSGLLSDEDLSARRRRQVRRLIRTIQVLKAQGR